MAAASKSNGALKANNTKTNASSNATNGLRRSRRSTGAPVKAEQEADEHEEGTDAARSPAKKVKIEEDSDVKTPTKKKSTPTKAKGGAKTGVKKEEQDQDTKDVKPSPGKTLAERKLSQHRSSANKTPFPRWPLPTHEEAEKVAWILGRAHGYRPTSEGGRGLPRFTPPAEEKEQFGGCGDVKDVIEATVRTILSCNTSGRNSTAAHQSLVERFGVRNWEAILDAPQKEVEEAIRCGGLAVNKSKNIQAVSSAKGRKSLFTNTDACDVPLQLLRDTKERYGSLSLQHLHDLPTPEVQEILLSFSGVGPKVQSCVQGTWLSPLVESSERYRRLTRLCISCPHSAFCLGRASFAVDTHVQRLSIALGWVPAKSSREQTYYHLNQRVQDELMYPLHVLLIKHGKVCSNCKAKGGGLGKNAKWESDESDVDETKEEADEKKVDAKAKGCPLKEAGLLGRRNLKLLPEEGETDEVVKKEEKA
jgi:endonuclease III